MEPKQIIIFSLILVTVVVWIIGQWKVFVKMGEPGWVSLIPIYSTIVVLRAIDRPLWWILLLIIPIIDLIVIYVISINLAERFDKGIGFAVGMVLLPFIFYPILGFGKAEFETFEYEEDEVDIYPEF